MSLTNSDGAEVERYSYDSFGNLTRGTAIGGLEPQSLKKRKLCATRFCIYPKAINESGVLGEHKAINHSAGAYAIGDLHTNTVESAFSLLKRGIVGTWHKISAKHLLAYLSEMEFRFNNRDNPYLFRDTLKRMLNAENLEFKELVAA